MLVGSTDYGKNSYFFIKYHRTASESPEMQLFKLFQLLHLQVANFFQ